jgi:hypothetical protein
MSRRRLDGGDQRAEVPAPPAPERALRDVREIVRDEPLLRDRLLEALADGPLSVPELAAAVALPEDEVMVWTMGMRKYGYVAELPSAGPDGYFRYQAVQRS